MDEDEYFDGHYMDDEVVTDETFTIRLAKCKACGAIVKRDDIDLHIRYHEELRTVVNQIIEVLTSWSNAWRRRNQKPRKDNG